MKMHVDPIVSVAAGGPARANCAIVAATKTTPAGVAHLALGDGREVRFLYSAEEAIALGQMLIVCGAIAAGGAPPVVAAPSPPPAILNGGRS